MCRLQFVAMIGLFLSVWISTSAYKILPNKVSFSEAQTYCETAGSTLASIHSYKDIVNAQTLCNNDDSNTLCWVGGIHNNPDDVSNCTYSWIDGSEWDYNPSRSSSNHYCQSNQLYTCIATSQSSNFANNTLKNCPAGLFRPICNKG